MAPRKKILVVDDDKTLQMILKTAFEKAGYQVIPALDAMQGLMMAKHIHEGPQTKVLSKSATIAEVLAAAETLLAGA